MERSELIHLLALYSGSAMIAQEYENKLTRKGLPEKKITEYQLKRISYDTQSVDARNKILAAFESRNRKKNGKTEA